jgi:tetratricopeptide (TPR) repeat protein
MKKLLLLLTATGMLMACGTMSTYQKITVPYQYLPLKPGIPVSSYFIAVEPATMEHVSLAEGIRFRTVYGTESSATDELTVAPSADEASLLIRLAIGEIMVVNREPASQVQLVSGNPQRKYKYVYRLPVTARFYTADKQLIWERTYDKLMQHYTQLQSDTELEQEQAMELSLIKEGYFKYLHRELVNDFTKLFYRRNLNYDAIIGESGPQKRMTLGNASAMNALNLTNSGQREAAIAAWEDAVGQYQSLINDQTKRKNGQLVVSVREKAIASYNCAQAYMWLQKYDEARTMISSAMNLSKEYASDSTNSNINSDRFMFPRLQEEIIFRQQSTQASR